MVRAADLEELGRRQAGVVTRGQLLATGWSSSAVDRALRSHRLHVIRSGVYRVCGSPWTRRAAQHAALLVMGDGAALARWTAAELLGFAEPRRGPVEVCAPHTRRLRTGSDHLLRLTRTRDLPPRERTEVDGLPTTSGARTLLDLAGEVSVTRLGELTATAMRLRACTPTEVRGVLAAHPTARGRRALVMTLALLADDGGSARSEVEVAALWAIVGAGLPRPVVAFRVTDEHGAFVAEVDLAYPDLRIAIEIDGFAWHSSPEHKRRDEQRQNLLVLAGWTVLRFSAAEVRRRPHALVAAVRQALSAP
jgi:very-short-patch-repair endonuclease